MKNHKLELQIGRMKQANTSIGGHGSYRKGHRCPWHLDLGRRSTTSWRAVEELTDESSCNSVKRSLTPPLVSSPRSTPPRRLLRLPVAAARTSSLHSPVATARSSPVVGRCRIAPASFPFRRRGREQAWCPVRAIADGEIRLICRSGVASGAIAFSSPNSAAVAKTRSVRYIPRTGQFSVQLSGSLIMCTLFLARPITLLLINCLSGFGLCHVEPSPRD
jgi:hypothetical protein